MYFIGELLFGYLFTSSAYVKRHSGSTLSGNHGVPRVHYKGKQGDFYIMVMGHVLDFFVYIVEHYQITFQLYTWIWDPVWYVLLQGLLFPNMPLVIAW